MDTYLVVQAFSNHKLVPRRLKAWWFSCTSYSNSIDFMVSHIYMTGNDCANSLVILGFNRRDITWSSVVYCSIFRYYLLDKLGTPKLKRFLRDLGFRGVRWFRKIRTKPESKP